MSKCMFISNTNSETEEISNERNLYLKTDQSPCSSNKLLSHDTKEMTFWEKFRYSIKLLFDFCGRI